MRVSRRAFLAGSAVAGLGVAAPSLAAREPSSSDAIPFDGPHQAGVITPGDNEATFAALDAIALDRGQLASALEALSSRARELTQGTTARIGEVDDPPGDSGTLGPVIAPDRLTVTISFGASLFDRRFGLKPPAGLTRMPAFADDDLDPARCHGDVLLQICANRRDTVVHTLRELLRPVRDAFALRWTIDGFQGAARDGGSRRNLFGFRDGTANPDIHDDALMRRLVWTPDGGTFQVVRVIRMHVEFWDRVGLREQETMIGRRRDTGAPLGGRTEFQDPKLDRDPKGERIATDAHIRLAHDAGDGRILRRGFNYHRGFDAAGQLDQGLIFVAFNQDISRQFATLQKRLAGEPMTDYITPVGGGYFYAPPGAARPGDWVGSPLFRT
ncbi:Dyp-type peroxidase [Solirubrobacter soli]|uniref:Dyp-type peroxidase n=1 Tax=Solirubrobacter soli TaxID=363832 RepID=UPI0003F536EC|nr:Dyp-type peroxidase [Solirubrobacter soli]